VEIFTSQTLSQLHQFARWWKTVSADGIPTAAHVGRVTYRYFSRRILHQYPPWWPNGTILYWSLRTSISTSVNNSSVRFPSITYHITSTFISSHKAVALPHYVGFLKTRTRTSMFTNSSFCTTRGIHKWGYRVASFIEPFHPYRISKLNKGLDCHSFVAQHFVFDLWLVSFLAKFVLILAFGLCNCEIFNQMTLFYWANVPQHVQFNRSNVWG